MQEANLFLLKHEDETAAAVTIDTLDGTIRKAKIINAELLPPGGNLSAEDLRRWWMRRAVPRMRGNIQKVLEDSGIMTTQGLLLKNLGISLSDHYWMCPAGSGLSWSEINPYENEFRDTVGEMQFQPSLRLKYIESSLEPGSSLQGELMKKWVIQEDGERCLIKGNYGRSCQQSINEVIASEIHKKQNKMPYTDYELVKIDMDEEQILGCMCKNFTNSKVEFIPAYDVTSSFKKRNDVSEYKAFIDACSLNGLDKDYVQNFLEYQIITDFLITNTDRHFHNFGVLRDVKTLKYIGMAPIFDSGNSMLWNRQTIPEKESFKNNLYTVPVNSFKKNEIELLKYVREYDMIDLTKIPPDSRIVELLKKDDMDEKRLSGLMEWYHAKLEVLSQLQLGKKLEEIADVKYFKKLR